MHRFRLRALAPALLLVVAGACANTFDATRLGVPATLASGSAETEGTPFRVTGHAVFGMWGLVKFSEPSLRKALATQLAAGQEVTNVRIRVRSRFGDLLITGLTLGLIVPRSVTFEGNVVSP